MKTTLLIMAAGIGSRFGTGIKPVSYTHLMGMLITTTPFKKSKLADGISAGIVILACVLSYFVYGTPTDNVKAQFIFAGLFVLVITYFFQSKERYKTCLLYTS